MKKLLVIISTALLAGLSMAAESRTWTDSQGRKTEAEMVGVKTGESGPVVLLKVEGREAPVEFPFNLLSEADQEYVKDNQPFDAERAAAQIDQLMWNKLKEANADIRKQKAEVAADRTMAREDRLKKMEELEFLEKMTHPTKEMTDEQFLRRAYLDIAGRIPTYQEALNFLDSTDRDKRTALIDDLLESDAFVSHFFNQISDLLRIRDRITQNGGNQLQGRAYVDWVKDQISMNRPWDEVVTELVTAEGKLWDNPAVGFHLTDLGMKLCNLSNTFTVFMGTEVTCAQCHDHPFEEVYQKDFFKMAAFFGNMEYRAQDPEERKTIRAAEQRLQEEYKEFNPRPNMERDQQLSILMGTYSYELGEKAQSDTRLPHDYKYDDGDPEELVSPATYFGELVELEDYETPRDAFASWLTSKENPRFTINLVNRLWKHAFGLAQIEPVYNIPGHLDGQAQNYELLQYLEELMKDLDYDVRDFLRVLYSTQAWQREASYHSPTLAQIDKGEYHFPAPVLRRMSAEQIWDSVVTLATDDPEAYQVRVWEDYRELMHTDWTKMTGQDINRFKEDFRNLGRGGMMMEEANMMETRVGGEQMVRASELSLPAPAGHFLQKFGQSDKQLIENATRLGSVPQVMMLMNGRLTNQTLSNAESKIMKQAASVRGNADTAETIFVSILSRRPTADELQEAKKAVRASGDETDESAYANLIWALLNTREFMFIQ